VKNKSALLILLSLLVSGCGVNMQERALYQSTNQGVAFGAVTGAAVGEIAGAGIPAGGAIGGIMGGAVGQYWYNKKMTKLQQTLAQKDGQIVILGDKVRVILPADGLFVANKDKLTWDAEPVLLALAEYLRQFGPLCLTIAGYTDAMPNRPNNYRLSKARAQRISSFLWAQGFHADCLRVVGYGQEHAIASNATVRGKAYNRRVEITFWQGA